MEVCGEVWRGGSARGSSADEELWNEAERLPTVSHRKLRSVPIRRFLWYLSDFGSQFVIRQTFAEQLSEPSRPGSVTEKYERLNRLQIYSNSRRFRCLRYRLKYLVGIAAERSQTAQSDSKTRSQNRKFESIYKSIFQCHFKSRIFSSSVIFICKNLSHWSARVTRSVNDLMTLVFFGHERLNQNWFIAQNGSKKFHRPARGHNKA